jgi:threonine dehydratase
LSDFTTPTPLERSPQRVSEFAGCGDVWLKREDQNPLGVFKWRSTLPVVRHLVESGATEIVTCSTGNHGAAVAWACGELGVKAHVFVPPGSVPAKLQRLDALAGGVGVAVGERDRTVTRVGVVAGAMPVMADSFAPGQPVAAPAGRTIADGLAVRVAIPLAVTRLRDAVDVVLRVSERDMAEALVAFFDAGIEVEPSAAAALAGLRQHRPGGDGAAVLVVTGRNVDPAVLERARSDPQSFPA